MNHPSFPIPRKKPLIATWAVGFAFIFLCDGQGFAQTTLTYENWAEGFFTQACCSCHHSSKSGKERFGAPKEFNFDTLELIRQQAADIRAVTIGDYRFMPPLGVTWPWDRDNLEEWLDAGMPGSGGSLVPVEMNQNEVSLHYQTSKFYFSQPLSEEGAPAEEKNFDYRYMEFKRASEKDDQIPLEYRMYIRKQSNGTVNLVRERWKDDLQGTRVIDYTPGLPILLEGGNLGAPEWTSEVRSHERRWSDTRTWKPPISEATTTQTWRVSTESIERLDNGVMLPVNALKTVQTELTSSRQVSWWFAKGFGLVRVERNEPSIGLQRLRKVDYNIVRDDDPLRDRPIIRSASTEWFPFVGPDYRPSEGQIDLSRMDYNYQFDHQQIAVFDSTLSLPPTSTPLPVPPDPTATPVLPTPTTTPVGFGGPSEGGSGSPTSVPTQGSGGEGSGPYSPEDPRISNLMAEDEVVDEKDLLIFLQHWHRTIE